MSFFTSASASKASISDTVAALDAAAGPKGYRCVPVSWEDAQRGTSSSGGLSSMGPNISDVRIWGQDGSRLYTLRSQNWNETLGFVSSRELAVVVADSQREGAPALESITLEKYLRDTKHAAYAKLQTRDMSAAQDDKISVRFQTVFLPVSANKFEFCTETYNYNTHSDDDPRNLLLLCTPQGTSVQQDGAGAKRVYYHAADAHGVIHRYWLEAEKSSHAVGSDQKETAADAAAAAARGKATAIVMGTPAMGTRFNVQMLIQVPLKQKPKPRSRYYSTNESLQCDSLECLDEIDGVVEQDFCLSEMSSGLESMVCKSEQLQSKCETFTLKSATKSRGFRLFGSSSSKTGTSNAARVSRGAEVDTWPGLTKKDPERDPSQHITATVTLYYTVVGGVPSAHDVLKAIADLDTLYASCGKVSTLATANATTGGNITAPLSSAAIVAPPYVPAPFAPATDTGFPV